MERSPRSIRPSALAEELGLGPRDAQGALFDRDIVAFYGDPAWEAKMADGKKNWDQTLSKNGDEYSFVITPTAGPQSYMPVNHNGVQRGHRPLFIFLTEDWEVRVVSGSEYNPVITDTFVLVPNPYPSRKAKSIKVVFREKD